MARHEDNLTRDMREAKRLGYGVHYGKYKADHPHTKEPEPPKTDPGKIITTCPCCGEQFVQTTPRPKKYCSEYCCRVYNNRKVKERREAEKEKET